MGRYRVGDRVSNETDVYSGNQGSVIKVATYTDASGNQGQFFRAQPQSASGTLDAPADAVTLSCDGQQTATFIVTGTFADVAVVVELSADGVTFAATQFYIDGATNLSFTSSTSLTVPTMLHVPLAGASTVRLRCVSITSGTAAVTAGVGVGAMPLDFLPVVATINGTVDVTTPGDGVYVVGLEAESDGVVAANDDAVTLMSGQDISFQIEGNSDGTFIPEMSVDGTNWHEMSVALITDVTAGTNPGALGNAAIYTLDIIGLISNFRIRLTSASSGSSTVTIKSQKAVD